MTWLVTSFVCYVQKTRWLHNCTSHIAVHLLMADLFCRISIHVQSSFPKHDKHHSKKWACNANSKFIDCVLEKSSSYLLISSLYTYLSRALCKNMISELDICIANSIFLDWRLARFGKELLGLLELLELFSKRDKRQSKNRGCSFNAKVGGHVLEKSSS